MNLAEIRGRMKTSNMKKKLLRNKNIRSFLLKNEKQLKRGDIVKLSGHTYVFLGYEKIENNYYAVTIEAVGGNIRSVGIFYRNFNDYETLNGKNIFPAEKRYELYRIVK